jgi:hypothetical protein
MSVTAWSCHMIYRTSSRLVVVSLALLFTACTDASTPSSPSARDAAPSAERSQVSQDRLAALFPEASREVLAMPGTVFADHDEVRGRLVFGVENDAPIPGIQQSLAARGISADEYVIERTEPIRMLATLRDRFRPTQAGTQIHFGNYLCSMGFNADHAGGRSFITASHCTNHQGGVEDTQYYQPLSSVDATVIATEVSDPGYVSGGSCSRGKVCRRSDASRELYAGSVESARGVIAKTTGLNSGSLETSGFFTVTDQDNTNTTFSGTIHKVGRTTGWTAGQVDGTCVTVNVSGSNIQQLCQTLVTNNSEDIVDSGDSGSPTFQVVSGDNVRLVGILWGGGGTHTFVFSPLKNVEDELGGVIATADGSGGGTGGGGGTDPSPCVPKGKNGNNCK